MKNEFDNEVEKFFGTLFGKPTILKHDEVIQDDKKHKNSPFQDILSGHENSENESKCSTNSCKHDR